LKKRGENENHAYFRGNWGEEKLRGQLKKLNYLHILALSSSKIFSLATLARLHFIFIPQSGDAEHIAYGMDGKVRLTFKGGMEKRRFSVPFLMT